MSPTAGRKGAGPPRVRGWVCRGVGVGGLQGCGGCGGFRLRGCGQVILLMAVLQFSRSWRWSWAEASMAFACSAVSSSSFRTWDGSLHAELEGGGEGRVLWFVSSQPERLQP